MSERRPSKPSASRPPPSSRAAAPSVRAPSVRAPAHSGPAQSSRAQSSRAQQGRPRPEANAAPAQSSAWVPETPRGRGAAPLSLGQVLVGAQAFVAQQTGAAMTQDQWRAVVGERIARHTRVGRLDAGVLQIKVSSSSWCAELAFLKSELLEKLRRAGREVKDLRFVVSQGAAQPKPARARRVEPVMPAIELPAELVARLEKVTDPNLRAAIAEAALHSLRMQAFKKQ
ncbi:MAG TPA: DUF721 domain-containing protein [Polyangiaceae bacterium]|nr:DUF721 domain-containing protein [Polyangiaceae bacterium]